MNSFLTIINLFLILVPVRNAVIIENPAFQTHSGSLVSHRLDGLEEDHRFKIHVTQMISESTNSSDSSNKCVAEYNGQTNSMSTQQEQVEDSVLYLENALFVMNNIEMIYARDEIHEVSIDDDEGYECSIAFSTNGSHEFVHVFEDNHRTIYTFSRDNAWIVHKSRREEGYFRTISWENVLDGPLYELRPTLKITIRTARVAERPIV
jgi:hypothetical protein